VLTKKVWEGIQKLTILKQLQTHVKAKGVRGNAVPPHYTPVHHHLRTHLKQQDAARHVQQSTIIAGKDVEWALN